MAHRIVVLFRGRNTEIKVDDIISFLQKVDWHENAAYNAGKSANERYFTKVFEVESKGWKPIAGRERNTKPLQRLVGKFGEVANEIKDKAAETAKEQAKAGKGKLIAAIAIGAAVIGAVMYYMKNKNQEAYGTVAAGTITNNTSSLNSKQKVLNIPKA